MGKYGKKFTEEEFAALLAKGNCKVDSPPSRSAPHKEPDIRNEPLAAEETQGHNRQNDFLGRVRISYHDQRKRLRDSDGGESKFHTDALVDAGVFEDDSPEFVPESPKITQEKNREEGLTIVVERIDSP